MAALTFQLQQAPTGIIENGTTADVFVIISQSVDVFTLANIEITGTSFTSFEGDNAVYRLQFQAPITGSGTVTITIPANALVGHTNPETILRINYGSVPIRFDRITLTKPSISSRIDGFVVTPNRIWIVDTNARTFYSYLPEGGSEIRSEQLVAPDSLRQLSTTGFVNRGLSFYSGHLVFVFAIASLSAPFPVERLQISFLKIAGGEPEFESWTIPASRCYGFDVIGNEIFIALQETIEDDSPFPIAPTFEYKVVRRTITGGLPPSGESEFAITNALDIVGLGASRNRIYLGNGDSGDIDVYSHDGVLNQIESLPSIGRFQFQSGIDFFNESLYLGWDLTSSGLFDVRRSSFVDRLPEIAIIPTINLLPGESIDLSVFTSFESAIAFGIGFDKPAWLSLTSAGVLSVESDAPQSTIGIIVPIVVINNDGIQQATFRLFVHDADIALLPTWKAVETITLVEGESESLFSYVSNARTITFADNYIAPTYLSIQNGIVSVAENAVDTDTEIDVRLVANNPNGGTPKTIQFVILDTIETIQNASFKQSDVVWQLEINGEDFSDLIEAVREINFAIDNIQINAFVPANALIQLNNEDGLFDLNNPDNYFETNGLDPNNGTVNILIKGGFEQNGQKIIKRVFNGVLLQILSVDDNSINLKCVDRTIHIRNAVVNNFGQTKETVVLDKFAEGIQGRYAIPPINTPISQQSLSGFSGTEELNIVENGSLKTEGVLNPLNVKPTEFEVISESPALENFPIVDFKSAYRGRLAKDLVNEILNHFQIYDNTIVLPENERLQPGFYSKGRIGIRADIGNAWAYPKKWITDGTKIYILMGHYSRNVNDTLIEHDPANDTYVLLYRWKADFEISDITTTDFDTFYVIATSSRFSENVPLGTYDPSELPINENSRIRIQKVVISADTNEDFVMPTDTYRPTLGTYYQVGTNRENPISARDSIVPENNTGFAIHNGFLYWKWSNNNNFGIARKSLTTGASEAVHTVTGEAHNNQQCFCFAIVDSVLYVGYVASPEASQSAFSIAQYNIAETTPVLVETYTSPVYRLATANQGIPIGVLELLKTDAGIHAIIQYQKGQ